MEEESWIEKSARLLRGEGFISLLRIILAKKEFHRGISELIPALKLIFLTQLALIFVITLRLLPRANVPPKFSRILLTSHSFYD